MAVLHSQPRWTIDKFPWRPEPFGQMCSERFNTEYFGRVMSAQEQIHADFFGGNCSPMRRFTGNKRIDVFLCDPVNLRACGAGHNTDHARPFRTKTENLHLAIQRLL